MEDAGFRSADCLMGIAHDVLGRISDICYFIADSKDINTALYQASSVTLQGETLAHALHSQSLGLCTALGSNDMEPLLHHAEAFRFAALLHLYLFLDRLSGPNTLHDTQIRDCVQNILTCVSQIPFKLHCEVGLIFPLFMAGVAGANDSRTVDYVQNRLEFIENWTKFKHITRLRDLLRILWATGRTDWEDLLLELDWQISLA